MGTYYKALLLSRAGDAKAAWNFAQNLSEDFRDSQPRVAVMIAQMAIDSGNEETGAALLNRVLAKYPDLVVARVRLATIRLKQNNPEAALAVIQPVRDSSDIVVIGLLSDLYLRLHRNDEALTRSRGWMWPPRAGPMSNARLRCWKSRWATWTRGSRISARSYARDPTNPSLVGPLINVLAQARRFPEALAAADKLGSDPKRRSAGLVYRGAILVLQHDNTGAMEAFDRAVKNDPRNIEALYSRAEFLATQQRTAEANRDLRAILALDAKNMPALMKLAEIAASQGADQSVQSILAQAIASSPRDAAPRLALLRYLGVRHKFQEAMAAANDLLKIQPNNTDCLVFMGQLQLSSGQKKEALETYRRLVTLTPTNSASQVFLASALSATGDKAGALRAMETAVKLAPMTPSMKAAQISLLMTQGSVDAAVASARSFRASNPGADGDILLSDTLEKAKLHDEAVAVLNKSLSDKPSRNVLLRLTRLAVQGNDQKHAAELMSNWLSNNPADNVVRTEYANLLMQQDDSAQRHRPISDGSQAGSEQCRRPEQSWDGCSRPAIPKRAISLLTAGSEDFAEFGGYRRYAGMGKGAAEGCCRRIGPAQQGACAPAAGWRDHLSSGGGAGRQCPAGARAPIAQDDCWRAV